ncbi:HYR domain-containing protein, partial [Geojedonia litorea]
TVTATDAAGNTDVCNFDVTVNDTEDPVVSCPSDITVNNDAGQCGANVNFTPTATDNCSVASIVSSPASGSFFAVGTTTVTVTATDAAGNTDVCNFDVTVNDTEDPVVSCPSDITVSNEAGQCGAIVNFTPTATDNCSVASIVSSPASGSFFAVGTTTVTVTATDAAGNTDVCNFDVTVNDTEDPVVSCPSDITVNNDAGQCGAIVNFTPTATDNCSVASIVSSPASGSFFAVGTTTVTVTATDAAGNTDVCTFEVTIQDNEIPIVSTNGDKNVSNDAGECSALVTVSASASDNCGVSSPVGVRSDNLQLNDPYPVGMTTIAWNVQDVNGNDALEVIQTVIVNDNEAPIAVCKNITVELDASGQAIISPYDIDGGSTDNCGIQSLSASKTSFNCVDITPLASTINKVVISQIYGGGGNTGATLRNDFIELFNAGTTTVYLNDWSVQYTGATGTSWQVTALTGKIQPGQYYLIQQALGNGGTTSLPDPDATGNIAMSATAGKVRLVNSTSTSPTSSQVIDFVGYGSANVFEGSGPTASLSNTTTAKRNSNGCIDTDNNSADFTVAAPSPRNSASPWAPCSVTPSGTPVVLTVTDIHGNTSTCTAYVKVEDNVDPTIDVAASDLTVECDGAGNTQALNDWLAANGGAEASDACGIVWSNNFTALSDDCGNTGSATVIFTVTDPSGNTATTTATFTIEDKTPPVLTIPSDVTVNCEDDTASSNTGVATATDICSNYSITQSDSSTQVMDNTDPGYYNYKITRTWTATDECNNSVSLDQIITVQDVTAPTILCPNNITINCEDDTTPANTGTATGTDNCSSVAITFSDVSTQNNDANNVGHYNYTITRTWTATDISGNDTTCVQVITVQDVTAPTILCPNNITINCEDDTTPANTGTATGTDNCSSVAITFSDVSTQNNDANNVGHYNYTITRTWTATDISGNDTTCVQVITVQDVTAPTILCPNSITINCEDDTTPANTGTATGTDNCSSVAITFSDVSTQNNDVNNVGHYNYTITRTWTATDISGNDTTCVQVITVQDVTAPTILCPNNITINCEDDTTPANTGTATGSDNCSVVAITFSDVSTQNNDVNNVGYYNYTITRTWTATDISGNDTTCVQVITVQDVTAPTILCPNNITINCEDDTTPANTGAATGTDICSAVVITYSDVSTQDPNINNPGHYNYTITRTWTATDITGNSVSCNQVITVQDVTPPVVDCVRLTIQLNENGNATITPEQLNNNSYDNCSPVSLSISQTNFSCSDVGGDLDELIISEYINGSDDNKAIEIYNGTGLAVNMSEYKLKIYPNGGTAYEIPLIGTVIDKDVYVIASVFASQPIQFKRDYAVSNLDFDSNDAIELLHNGVPVDYIPGGSGWLNTLVRKENIQSGSASGDLSEWNAYPLNTFNYLGSHNISVTDNGNNVLLTVTDVSGNLSTCEAKVFVQDVTAPVVVCNAITVQLDATGNYILTTGDKIAVGLGSEDSCGIASYEVSPNVFDCTNVGPNAVTLTVTDKNGNSATCNTTITVEDKVDPIALCRPITIQLDANGNASITPSDIDGGSSDACGITLSASKTSFDCSNVGANTVTLTVEDANGNSASCDAIVTVEDKVNPIAICKDITVTLGADGTVTIAEDAVNNGSNDACGGLTYDTDITSFTCADVGNPVLVTLTVTDVNGNSSTCEATVTVNGLLPVIQSIVPSELPPFCQDAAIQLTVNTNLNENDIRSYQWVVVGQGELGAITNEKVARVYANGKYGVTVTSETNCTDYLEYTVTNFDVTNLIASYTILAQDDIYLHGSNLVQSGGLGVTGANGLIKLHQATTVVDFGKAKRFDLNQGSVINGGITMSPAAPQSIPAFVANTYSNAGSPNVIANTNQTLTGSVFNVVQVGQGVTVTFTQPNVYINQLVTQQNASIEFGSCANVFINQKFTLAQFGTINANGKNVVIYVNADIQIEKGSYVRARMHSNGNEFLVKGENANKNKVAEPTVMKGLFIGRRVHGSINVKWEQDQLCDTGCPIAAPISSSRMMPSTRIDLDDDFQINAWPNPSDSNFTLKVKTQDRANRILIQVYDMSNKLVHVKEFNPNDNYKFGTELEAGVYIVKVTQSGKLQTVRLVKY